MLRKILSKTAAPLGYLQKANGSWSDSRKESLDLLLDAHFTGSQQTAHPPEKGAGEGIELDPLISDRNMKWSIHSFKPYKSPGPDGITAAHVQQAGQIAINWLKKMFQSILAVGDLPKGANIVALDWCDVPSRPRARFCLPAAIKVPEDILFIVQECNTHLPTKDWKVVKEVEH